jgi:hypothetical protein
MNDLCPRPRGLARSHDVSPQTRTLELSPENRTLEP